MFICPVFMQLYLTLFVTKDINECQCCYSEGGLEKQLFLWWLEPNSTLHSVVTICARLHSVLTAEIVLRPLYFSNNFTTVQGCVFWRILIGSSASLHGQITILSMSGVLCGILFIFSCFIPVLFLSWCTAFCLEFSELPCCEANKNSNARFALCLNFNGF